MKTKEKMYTILGLTSLLIFLIGGTGVNAQDRPIEVYQARLSATDHHNSKGVRLNSVAGIIRQDRANYHVFKKRDTEDHTDSIFSSKKARAMMEKMLRAGRFSAATKREILSTTPLIEVQIFLDHIHIEIISDKQTPPKQTPPLIKISRGRVGKLKVSQALIDQLSPCFPTDSPFVKGSAEYPLKKIEGVPKDGKFDVYHLYGKKSRYLIFRVSHTNICETFKIGEALARSWGRYLPQQREVKVFLLSQGDKNHQNLALAIRDKRGEILAATFIQDVGCDAEVKLQDHQIFSSGQTSLELICDSSLGALDFSRNNSLYHVFNKQIQSILGPISLGVSLSWLKGHPKRICSTAPAGRLKVIKTDRGVMIRTFELEEQSPNQAQGEIKTYVYDRNTRRFTLRGPLKKQRVSLNPTCEQLKD